MKNHQKGQCMCSSIRFSYSGSPKFVSECMCHSCREAHGATAVCWVGVNDGQFQISKGEALLKWYQSSEASMRGFCSNCGTTFLFRSSQWPGETHMTRTGFPDDCELDAKVLVFDEEFPKWSLLKHES